MTNKITDKQLAILLERLDETIVDVSPLMVEAWQFKSAIALVVFLVFTAGLITLTRISYLKTRADNYDSEVWWFGVWGFGGFSILSAFAFLDQITAVLYPAATLIQSILAK